MIDNFERYSLAEIKDKE